MKGAARPLEKHIQRQVREWLSHNRVDAFHVPNGSVLAGDAKARAIQSRALKSAGVVNGFPDLILVKRADGPAKVGFFEVKREGEKLRPEQADFSDRCQDWQLPYAVVRSVEDAREALQEWGWM